MFNAEEPTEYLKRAEMHEQLAAATDDIPARKMHLAMAAEFRRKALETKSIQVARSTDPDPTLKLNVVIG